MCCTSGNKSFQNWKKGVPQGIRPSISSAALQVFVMDSFSLGKKVEVGKANLEEIEAYALGASEPKTSSGKQDSGETGDEPCTMAQSIWALWIDLWNRQNKIFFRNYAADTCHASIGLGVTANHFSREACLETLSSWSYCSHVWLPFKGYEYSLVFSFALMYGEQEYLEQLLNRYI